MTFRLSAITLFVATALTVILYSFRQPVPTSGLKSKGPRPFTSIDCSDLKNGDVILRKGRGFISDVLRNFSLHDRTFSHAGILFKVGSSWNVFHIEGGDGSAVDGVRWEPVQDFCNPMVSDAVAVFRITDEDAVRASLLDVCVEMTHRHPTFDTRFDLSSLDRLYCTELVALAFRQASRGGISLPLTSISGLEYISCENLYINDYARQQDIKIYHAN